MHEVRDVVLHERESVAAEEMLDVGGVTGDQIVHADHFVTALEKELAQVRAEESSTARDQGPRHSVLFPAPDRNVREPFALHAVRIVDVAQIDDNRLLEA